METARRVAWELRDLDLEYLEDPTAGIEGTAAVARHTHIPLSTNMCVTAFADVAPAFRARAVQVVLGDHHAWGGLTAYRHLGAVCRTLDWGLSQHSNSHLGISFAGMIHAAAAIPELTYASDTYYPWNPDDIVRETDRFRFQDGAVALWGAPGLGVTLDADKFAAAAERYQEQGAGLARDDIGAMRQRHPDWLPLMPKW